MAALYESAVPDHLTDFHFKIREPAIPPRNFEGKLHNWIETIMMDARGYQHRPLSVEALRWRDNEVVPVVFIQFRLSRRQENAGMVLGDVIRHLCQAIADPRQSHHVKTLSRRGLLGISPIHRSAEQPFRNAIARRTYEEGLRYLQEIDNESRNYLPSWQIAMHFAVVAGINIFPLRYAFSLSEKLAKQKNISWGARMLQLYGPTGVETAASFLTGLLDRRGVDPGVTEQCEREYHQHLEALQDRIGAIIEKIHTMRAIPGPTSAVIDRHNDEVLDLCYEALGSFTECMRSQQNVMLAYIEGRKDATRRMSRETGYSVAMLFNTFMMAKATVVVPLAKRSALQILQAGLSWTGLVAAPTMPAFAPITVGISFVITAAGVYQLYTTAGERQELEAKIEQLKEAATLVSNAWTVTDETALFLKWTSCIDSQAYQRDMEFLREADAEGVVQRWENLVEGVQRQEGSKRKAGGGGGQRGNAASDALRWISGQAQSQARNRSRAKSREQKMIVRCILNLVGQQVDELEDILRRLRGEAEHD